MLMGRPNGMSVGAVIVAAGSSSRMGGEDKLFADLRGKRVLARTIQAFEDCPEVHRLIVVASPNNQVGVNKVLQWEGYTKATGVCLGGPTRQESVRQGLRWLGECDLVAVHDGARPLVTPELISRGVELARRTGSALCAVREKNTIKVVSPEGKVLSTPDRSGLWEAQTPQIFRYRELLEVHERAYDAGETYTDDAAMLEAAGHLVWVYEGSYQNLKITTAEDLLIARALLEARS